MMLLYSLALTISLLLASPWWLARMLTTERYREGLAQRLGRVPQSLRTAAHGKRVLWLHAVSVGEVLAATRLVSELEAALGADWLVTISTTTRTGQQLAQERFGAGRVFYMPLDFAFAVRAYLNALDPTALILMESELWPRLLDECHRRRIPTIIANARMSDRSFARAMKFKAVWSRVLRKVTLFLAQSEQDAERLTQLGAGTVQTIGNLKYDVHATAKSEIGHQLRKALGNRPIVIFGSVVESEEHIVAAALYNIWAAVPPVFFVIAPRHPERFTAVKELTDDFGGIFSTELMSSDAGERLKQTATRSETGTSYTSQTLVMVLNTIGDLSALYSLASVAFVGGSLTRKGGHNPIEPAQFGRPVVTGPSMENFRAITSAMLDANALEMIGSADDLDSPSPVRDPHERIGELQDGNPAPTTRLREALEQTIIRLLKNPAEARSMGERGRQVFESQQGATARAVEAILKLVQP